MEDSMTLREIALLLKKINSSIRYVTAEVDPGIDKVVVITGWATEPHYERSFWRNEGTTIVASIDAPEDIDLSEFIERIFIGSFEDEEKDEYEEEYDEIVHWESCIEVV